MYFKKIFLSALVSAALFITSNGLAQQLPKTEPDPPKNWHQMDLKADGFYGVSLNQAYLFLKGKKSKTVIVTTIDSGIDTAQKDLQSILWINPNKNDGYPHQQAKKKNLLFGRMLRLITTRQ